MNNEIKLHQALYEMNRIAEQLFVSYGLLSKLIEDVPEDEVYIYNYYAWPYMNVLSDNDMAYLKHCHLCAQQIYPDGISEERKKSIPSLGLSDAVAVQSTVVSP